MAIYHLRATTGTRARGQSARAKIDYLTRGGRYENCGDRVLHVESGNMPAWALAGSSQRARAAATVYWTAADAHERSNARLYKHLQIALPVELPYFDRVTLVRRFAAACASVPGGHLPFTFTLHEGRGTNPHADLVLSERTNDGHERTPARWFKRAIRAFADRLNDPSLGGAPKTRHLKPRAWLVHVRAFWAQCQNEALEAVRSSSRVDHRSLASRGIDRLPSQHLGPRAVAIERRTDVRSRRREDATEREILERELADSQLALKAARDAWDRWLSVRARTVHQQVDSYCGVRVADEDQYRAWAENRKQRMDAWYVALSRSVLAGRYRVTRHRDIIVVEDAENDIKVVDAGPHLVAANGFDAEVSVILAIVELKLELGVWTESLTLTGHAEFRNRAANAIGAAGIAIGGIESGRRRKVLTPKAHTRSVR